MFTFYLQEVQTDAVETAAIHRRVRRGDASVHRHPHVRKVPQTTQTVQLQVETAVPTAEQHLHFSPHPLSSSHFLVSLSLPADQPLPGPLT